MKYGYFSTTAASRHGSAIYSTPEGGEVEVTCVGSHEVPRNNGYVWADARNVGEVKEYLRVAQLGSLRLFSHR